jgi:hypothetical protein
VINKDKKNINKGEGQRICLYVLKKKKKRKGKIRIISGLYITQAHAQTNKDITAQ